MNMKALATAVLIAVSVTSPVHAQAADATSIQIRENNLLIREIKDLKADLKKQKISRTVSVVVAVSGGLLTYGGIKLGALEKIGPVRDIADMIGSTFTMTARVVTGLGAAAAAGGTYFFVISGDQIDSLTTQLNSKEAQLQIAQDTLESLQ